jgi:predicted signal transduction protein with EAL and GGDEF domain
VFRGENKRLVPCAYLFLAIMLVLIMLAELLLIDWSDAKTEYTLFWMLLGLPLLLSVVCGGVPAFLIWRRIRNKQKKEQEKAPNRPSYYQT